MSDCCQHCQAEIFCIGKMPPGHEVDCLRCTTTPRMYPDTQVDLAAPASSMSSLTPLSSGTSHIHDLIVRRAIERA